MYSDWNHSSNGLPREGQRIEFVLDCRSVAMEGTYDQQVFHSHWAEYTVDRVRSWRNLTQAFDCASTVRDRAASVLSNASRPDTHRDFVPAGVMAHAA